MTLTDAEAFLRDFHRRHPGCTSRAFAELRDATGQTSYTRLARLVRDAGSRAILDLACGDGYLLAQIAANCPSGTSLTGVDMSAAELAIARARPDLRDCTWLEARAQTLPIPDAAVDAVVCHMALMLMAPVAPVLWEIHRILRPNGLFTAIVSGTATQGDAGAAFLAELRQINGWSERGPTLGDRQIRSHHGLQTALTEAGFTGITVTDFAVRRRVSIAEAWAFFMEMYTLDWFTADEIAGLHAGFVETLGAALGPDGLVLLHNGLRQMSARRQ